MTLQSTAWQIGIITIILHMQNWGLEFWSFEGLEFN